MRVAITGHTSGLGKAVYAHMQQQGHEVVGFSRATGYDLSTAEGLISVAQAAKDFDLFVNNAHVKTVQANLIEALHKTVPIITVGSIGADYANTGNYYYVQKLQIEAAHKKFKKLTSNPMLLLKLGYLEDYSGRKFITYNQVLGAIDYWMTNQRVSLIEMENIDYAVSNT